MILGNVAHVVPEYLPRSATFIYTLLRHQERFRPVVLARTTSNLDEFPIDPVYALAVTGPVVGVRHLLGRLRNGASSYERRIVERAHEHRCMLVHAHFGWSGRDSVAAADRLDIPLVTTFYGRDISEAGRARRRHPYARLFERGSLFVCEGPTMAGRLGAIGAPESRIRVVPIGIDLEQFPFADRPPREPLVIVQCARFVEKKGIDLTLEAFARARSAIGPCELVLIGDGPLRPEVETRIARLDLDSSVRLTGLVSHDEYRRIAASAHLCVQPSRTAADGDSEGGAPVVLLEMQAMGVPIVATAHADIPFVVPHPDDLVPENDVEALADAIVRVANESDEDRRRSAVEARDFIVRRHDASVSSQAVERTYDEALA